MIKIFKLCFDNWYFPLLIFFASILIFLYSFALNIKVGFAPLYFGSATLLISSIYELYKKNWKKFILRSLLCGFSFLVFYSIDDFFAYHPDNFADNLKIPTNIKIELPLDHDPKTNITETSLQLFNSLQPGLYMYAFYTRKIERGKVFLKAFEITHNTPLSADELQEKTSIEVHNNSDSIMKFITTDSEIGRPFTIYEGAWGKPYAARFEVWFISEDSRRERKLFEKNYKIEGWDR